MPKVACSLYLATPMTGYFCDDLWKRAINDISPYEKEGLTAITPVMGEGIPFAHVRLADRDDAEMMRVWKGKDKSAIRDTNILVVKVPAGFSQGIFWEGILGRGVLWKITVLVIEGGRMPGFISRVEADYVATSHAEAAMVIRQRWGTRRQRTIWRLKMLNRKLLPWIWAQIKEFK